jgi:hypothetical protein
VFDASRAKHAARPFLLGSGHCRPTTPPEHRARPPTSSSAVRRHPHTGPSPLLHPPPFPRKEHAPNPHCLLSTPAAGAAATPPGNRSRRRRFNPLTVSSQLRPSSSSTISPSSLPVPPSCYRSTSRSSPSIGAHRRRGNATAPDCFSASPPRRRPSEHLPASPCPMPSQVHLRARWRPQHGRAPQCRWHGPAQAPWLLGWANSARPWAKNRPRIGRRIFIFFISFYNSKNSNKLQKCVENTMTLRKL